MLWGSLGGRIAWATLVRGPLHSPRIDPGSPRCRPASSHTVGRSVSTTRRRLRAARLRSLADGTPPSCASLGSGAEGMVALDDDEPHHRHSHLTPSPRKAKKVGSRDLPNPSEATRVGGTSTSEGSGLRLSDAECAFVPGRESFHGGLRRHANGTERRRPRSLKVAGLPVDGFAHEV